MVFCGSWMNWYDWERSHHAVQGCTSPVIEGLASWTLDQARDPVVHDARPVASRTRRRVIVQPVFPVDILGAYILLPIPPQLRERGR